MLKVPSHSLVPRLGSRISAAQLPHGRCRTPRYDELQPFFTLTPGLAAAPAACCCCFNAALFAALMADFVGACVMPHPKPRAALSHTRSPSHTLSHHSCDSGALCSPTPSPPHGAWPTQGAASPRIACMQHHFTEARQQCAGNGRVRRCTRTFCGGAATEATCVWEATGGVLKVLSERWNCVD